MEKIVDNFDLLKKYILDKQPDFDKDKDMFYIVEIMRRGKDNPDLPAVNLHYKNYYINEVSDLDKFKKDIMSLCNLFNMRAYIGVCVKSYKQTMMDTTAEMARRVAVHDYKRPYAIWTHCVSGYFEPSDKTWVLDVDKEDADEYGITLDELLGKYKSFIEEKCEPFREIIEVVPTVTGKHLLARPFNVAKFNEECIKNGFKPHSETDNQLIKRNHLTLLYYRKRG